MNQEETEDDISTEVEREEILSLWIAGFKNFDPDEFLTFIIDPNDDIVSIFLSIPCHTLTVEFPF